MTAHMYKNDIYSYEQSTSCVMQACDTARVPMPHHRGRSIPCTSAPATEPVATFSSAKGNPSLRTHLAVPNVPDEKIPHLISGNCSGLAPLASVYKVHHRGSDDEMVVADQPAP